MALGAAMCGLVAQAPAAAAAPVLPDLDQLAPTQVSISPLAGPRYNWGSPPGSQTDQRAAQGVGPMIVRARRSSTSAPMIVDQVMRSANGPETVRRNIGPLQYASADTHWHYKGLDNYELRRASDLKRCDRRTRPASACPTSSSRRTTAGADSRTRSPCKRGSGPGYVDLYQANLEGQNIEVTGIKAGLYYLVHRVNADSSLCESNLSNNAAATKIRLWPNGYGVAPYV